MTTFSCGATVRSPNGRPSPGCRRPPESPERVFVRRVVELHAGIDRRRHRWQHDGGSNPSFHLHGPTYSHDPQTGKWLTSESDVVVTCGGVGKLKN